MENITSQDWQHIVVTWKTGEGLNLYVNGELNELTFEGQPLDGVIEGVETLIAGKGVKDDNTSWKGKIDELKIYNKKVTSKEVIKLMNNISLENQKEDATYYSLKTNPDGSFHLLDDQNKLRFTYLEKYTGHLLKYKIFDYKRNIVWSDDNNPLFADYGNNFLTVDLSSLESGFYTLQVTDQKGNKQFLKFQKGNLNE